MRFRFTKPVHAVPIQRFMAVLVRFNKDPRRANPKTQTNDQTIKTYGKTQNGVPMKVPKQSKTISTVSICARARAIYDMCLNKCLIVLGLFWVWCVGIVLAYFLIAWLLVLGQNTPLEAKHGSPKNTPPLAMTRQRQNMGLQKIPPLRWRRSARDKTYVSKKCSQMI